MRDDMFYFGKYPDKHDGHCLYNTSGQKLYDMHTPLDFPVKECVLDGGMLPPKGPQREGKASLVYINGWTVLAFWDRSGDRRGNSCSNFIMRGTVSFDRALSDAKESFPKIFERFDFDITPAFREVVP